MVCRLCPQGRASSAPNRPCPLSAMTRPSLDVKCQTALSTSRLIRRWFMAAPGVQIPPGSSRTSHNKQIAHSEIILEVTGIVPAARRLGDRIRVVAAVHESVHGTFEKCRRPFGMSANPGKTRAARSTVRNYAIASETDVLGEKTGRSAVPWRYRDDLALGSVRRPGGQCGCPLTQKLSTGCAHAGERA